MTQHSEIEADRKAPRSVIPRRIPRPERTVPEYHRLAGTRAWLVGGGVLLALVFGWLTKGRLGIDPGEGVGYWLGIAGVTMMIVLLGYPLRKRSGAAIPGSVGTWFRLHMMLGLLGPLAILYHAGFGWSAVNSGVALWAMLLVAASGLIGRYIHVHLYRGHSLRHRFADEIIADLRQQRDRLDRDGSLGQSVEERLAQFQAIAQRPRRRLLLAIITSVRLWATILVERRGLTRQAETEVRHHMAHLGASLHEQDAAAQAVRDHIRDYLAALVDAGSFSTFERLFALWHVAHIPLYLFLGITATIHVLAAHYF